MVGHSYPIRLLQGCRNPDTICVRAIENVSHSISNPLFQTTGHAVWSTTFIYSSFIQPPCTLILETAVCRAHEEKSEGSQPDQNRESFSRFPARLRSSWQGEPGPTCPRLGLPQYAPTQCNCFDLSQQPLRTTILLTSDLVKGE